MRIIQKQISLEPMTSRLPSVWPAYYNNEPDIYYFDDASLKNRDWAYTSNWGMVPVNIVVFPTPYSCHTDADYSVVDGCHCYGGDYETNVGCSNEGSLSYDELNFSGDCELCIDAEPCNNECNFVLSFENLSKWYYFFNEYYNLLKQYSHCDRVYTSAEDYYNYESLTKYADQMIYGTDRQTYIDLDEEFANKGGRVYVDLYDKDGALIDAKLDLEEYYKKIHDEYEGDRTAIINVYDGGFFKWICDNVVPSFTIPMAYRNYWKKDILFYPDVIKWMKWFNDREDLNYEEAANFELEIEITEIWDCKAEGVDDCCDCEEYFGRGGKRIYDKMKEWYNQVQGKILSSINKSCSMPTIILPTELQLSIDDIGEFSIFSTDYELGKDYRVAHYGDSANTYGGTVQTIDGVPMYFSGACQNNGLGFTFNPDYMERYVSSCMTCGYEGVFAEICPKCGDRHIKQISYDPDRKENIEDVWSSYTERYITHEYCCDGECENCSEKYDNRDEFFTNVTYYTYDENNVKHTGTGSKEDAKNEIKKKLTKIYPLTTCENGWILIDGVLYEIKEAEFGKYDQSNVYLKDNTYLVFREEGTNTPYTFVNGKKVFADFYPAKDSGVFYFPFFLSESAEFVEKCSGKLFNIENYMQFKRHEKLNHIFYIEYHGKVYNLGTDGTQDSYEIDGNEYYKTTGYTVNEYGDTLYCIDGVKFYNDASVIGGLEDYTLEGYDTPSCTVDENNKNIIKIEPFMDDDKCAFTIYSVEEITGHTVSKIADIRLYNVLTDDIGNTIEGIYDLRASGATAHQPPQGTELELIYQVGNTANINRFSQSMDDMDEIIVAKTKNGWSDFRNYFVGDIITKMTFYYKDYNDNIVTDTIHYAELDSGDTRIVYDHDGAQKFSTPSGYTSLKAIQLATEVKDTLEESGKTKFMKDDIYCDITYYVGATLSRIEGKQYNLSSKARGDKHNTSNGEFYYSNYGVEYIETVRFVKTNWEYYLKKPKDEESTLPSKRKDPCKHSISYPVYVYVLTQDLTRVDESQYDTEYSVPMADFKFEINVFSGNSDTFADRYPEEMTKHNDLQVFPTFREEYRFGVSTLENVDSDIYIDRGINAAFEKHLKLGEVTSLEALEQYGNGYFKIMES